MKTSILTALVVTALSSSGAVYAQTLEGAVAKTLVTNPEINMVLSRTGAAQMAHKGAFSGYLPSLDVSAGIGKERTSKESLDTVTYTRKELGLSFRQMLFDGFATSAEYDRTGFEATAEQYALYAEAEDVSLKAVSAYLNVVKGKEILALSEENLVTHEKIYSDIKKRTDAGIGSSSDLSQIEGRLARANSNVINAQNNLADAETDYLRVVNEFPEELEVPNPDFSALPDSFAKVIKKAMDEHPRLKSSRQDIYAAHAQHEVAKSNYYPKFTLEVDNNMLDNADGNEGRNDKLAGMLRMRYNLYQGGKDKSFVEQTAFSVSESKYVSERTIRELHQGARLSWDAKRYLKQQTSFLNKHVVASEKTRDAYAKQFTLGKRTLLDVLNTETELFDAKSDLVGAKYDEMESNYRILNSMGQLLGSLKVARPAHWQEKIKISN